MVEKMKRLQIYLEPEMDRQLAELSVKKGVSKAELIRNGVKKVLRETAGMDEDPILGIIGMGRGRAGKVSIEHDRYLVDRNLTRLKK